MKNEKQKEASQFYFYILLKFLMLKIYGKDLLFSQDLLLCALNSTEENDPLKDSLKEIFKEMTTAFQSVALNVESKEISWDKTKYAKLIQHFEKMFERKRRICHYRQLICSICPFSGQEKDFISVADIRCSKWNGQLSKIRNYHKCDSFNSEGDLLRAISLKYCHEDCLSFTEKLKLLKECFIKEETVCTCGKTLTSSPGFHVPLHLNSNDRLCLNFSFKETEDKLLN